MAQLKDDESKKLMATKVQAQVEKKAKKTINRLTESEMAKKSVEVAMARFKREAQEQCGHVQKVEEWLSIAKENVKALKKELRGKKQGDESQASDL